MRSILLTVSTLAAGGAERVVAELANRWVERQWRVGVLTVSNSVDDRYSLHSTVTRISLGLMSNSSNLLQSLRSNIRRTVLLRQAVRDFQPDVILSFVDQTNVLVLAATGASGLPVIVSERVDPRHYQLARAWAAARRLLYPTASALVVQTHAVAEWAQGFVPARKVHVIPNFVRSLPLPDPTNRERLILGVGRLDRQKGFDLLLHAYAASRARSSGYRVAILGEGPARQPLQALAEELRIRELVEMPGVVASPEQWMQRAAVFVLPSRYEGFPNALLEAMAMGCAVIAADCPSGPAEIVRHGRDGLLVPTGNVASLSAALDNVLGDASLRERLGAAAGDVRQRYAVERVLDSWEAVIAHVVST